MKHPFFDKVKNLPDVVEAHTNFGASRKGAHLLPRQDLLEFESGKGELNK
jgi:hypothetical protein